MFGSGRTPIELDFLYMPAYTAERNTISVDGSTYFIETVEDAIYEGHAIERTVWVK